MDNSFEPAIINRLRTLNHTQRSIEKTSRALLKNKHLAKDIVKLWFKEFRASSEKLKLAFIHLANDVITRGVHKAPQFAQLFEPVLQVAFKETASIQSQNVRAAIAHLLVVWADRNVYQRTFLRQLRSICQKAAAHADAANPSKAVSNASPFDFSFTSALINASTTAILSRQQVMGTQFPAGISPAGFTPSILMEASLTPSETPLGSTDLTDFREELQRDLDQEKVKPPETRELIKQLEAFLQSAPSADAAVRQKIAEFPAEVSDPQMAMKLLTDGADPKSLVERIQSALSQLEAYNRKLDAEMTQRTNLALGLRAYRNSLQEDCELSRSSIKEIRSKRTHAGNLQANLESHIQSLPDDIDLRRTGDCTPGGTHNPQPASSSTSNIDSRLQPLPSIGDLFS